jgi:hypothetical protein
MQAEIKTENGVMMARPVKCDPWMRLPTKIRIAEGIPIRIAQWINPEQMSAWWVLDRLVMSMLYSDDSPEGEFSSLGDDGSESRWVRWDHPVLLYCPDIKHSPDSIYLLNENGEALSGSNIYASRRLCLGEYFNHLSTHPVELLISNEANDDLGWQGEALLGEWHSTHFQIETWPRIQSREYQVPPPVAENFSAWSRP